jgi:hypothetical protein
VFSAHEVAKLALDLGACGPVVVLPSRVALAPTSAGDRDFVGADADRAPPVDRVHLSRNVQAEHASAK